MKYLHAFLQKSQAEISGDTYPQAPKKPKELLEDRQDRGSLGSLGTPPQVSEKIEGAESPSSFFPDTYPQAPKKPKELLDEVLARLIPAEAEDTTLIPPEWSGPHRTPWGTVTYSAPDALPIELFGPAPPPGAPGDDLRAEPTHKAAEPDPRNSADTYLEDPRKPLPPIADVRRIVADWPIPFRERWGRRANELADDGVSHPDDERQAFVELQNTNLEEADDDHRSGPRPQALDRQGVLTYDDPRHNCGPQPHHERLHEA